MVSQQKHNRWSVPRAHPRFLLDLRLVIRASETMYGRTKDIAEGGLGATIPGNISLGDIVELEFQLPTTGETLTFASEVRYRQGFQYGFKFLHASEIQREHIRRMSRDLPLAP